MGLVRRHMDPRAQKAILHDVKKWNSNGLTLKSHCQFDQEGAKHGTCRHWHSNGQVRKSASILFGGGMRMQIVHL